MPYVTPPRSMGRWGERHPAAQWVYPQWFIKHPFIHPTIGWISSIFFCLPLCLFLVFTFNSIFFVKGCLMMDFPHIGIIYTTAYYMGL